MQRLDLPECSFECALLSDGRGVLPLEVVFDEREPDERAAVLGAAEGGQAGPYNSLLVRAPDTLLLVDTGLGDITHPWGGRGGELWAELDRAGVAPDDVNVVVISHGHLDHIAGLSRDGKPSFPQARYVIAEEEWAYWTDESVLAEKSETVATLAREQLPPLETAGVLDKVRGETEVADGVRVVPAPGHTAGHLAVEVGDSGGLLFVVDAFVHTLQLERPDWGHGLDIDPETAIASRRQLLARARDRGHVIAASHWDDLQRQA